MTSINRNYTVYAPSPPPPPPPVILDVDGNPKEPDIVVVIGQKTDPYKSLLPYKGLTGAAENSRRDMAFAMAGPEDRAIMMGLNPFASDGFIRDDHGYTTLELNETSGWRNPTDQELSQLIGGSYNRELTASTRTTGRGTELDDYDRALNGLQPRTRWDPDTLSPQSLTSIGVKSPGSTPFQRELIGDGIDGIDFARALANKAGYGASWGNRANWQINGNGGIATFRGSDSFQVTIRGAGNSNSGVGAIEVKWNTPGIIKWHVVNK